MTLANTSFPGGGSYAVEIMLVTMAQANATSPYPIGLNCFRDNAATPVCTNLVFVRSTGTVTDSAAGGATSPAPPGYTARKTLQVLARAYAPSVLANGVVAGTPAALRPIHGNVLLSGSAHLLEPAEASRPSTGTAPALAFKQPEAATADPEIPRRLPAQQGGSHRDPVRGAERVLAGGGAPRGPADWGRGDRAGGQRVNWYRGLRRRLRHRR
jgi:hypothetical protein